MSGGWIKRVPGKASGTDTLPYKPAAVEGKARISH
jgi:hypothetical protein